MKNTIWEMIQQLFDEQRFAVIATQGKENPYTNLVTFIVDEKGKNIYFPTSKKTKKYENLINNARIAILIDNRGNTPKDIENAVAVTALGTTKETKNQQIISQFLKKHPYLKTFIQSPDCIMIEINVEQYVIVDTFQHVNILQL